LGALGESMVALGDAARHLEVHALVLERLRVDDAVDELRPLLARMRVAYAHLAEAALEAREVLVEPERHARVHRHHFVDAIAEDEPAVEHRDRRLFDGKELAVQVDQAHSTLTSFVVRRYFTHRRSVSHARPSSPAAGTASSATRGYSPSGLPSRVTRSVPTRWP